MSPKPKKPYPLTPKPNRMEERKLREGIDRQDNIRKRQNLTLNSRKRRREENVKKKRRQMDDLNFQIDPYSGIQDILAKYEEELQFIKYVFDGNDPESLKDAVTQCRQLSSVPDRPPILEMIQQGWHEVLIKLVKNDDKDIVDEAIWTLTNMVSGTSQETEMCVEAGIIDAFLYILMNSTHIETKAQAAWGLGNIAGDCIEYRDALLDLNVISHILPCFEGTLIESRANAIWTLSNLLRGVPKPPLHLTQHCLSVFPSLLGMADQEILIDTLWAISYISDGKNDRIEAVINSGISPRLVSMLSYPNKGVVVPALRAVGNLLTGSHSHTQILLDSRVLSNLEPLLYHENASIKKEAAWAISNITAGTSSQIQLVLESSIFTKLIDIICDAEKAEVKKEAAWAICNVTTGGTYDQLMELLCMHRCIFGLCEMLLVSDTELTILILETLHHGLMMASAKGNDQVAELLESCGGLSILETLNDHHSELVYETMSNILRDFFNADVLDYKEDPNEPPHHDTFQF